MCAKAHLHVWFHHTEQKRQYIQASWFLGLQGDALETFGNFFCKHFAVLNFIFSYKCRDVVGIKIYHLLQKDPTYYVSTIEAELQLPSEGQCSYV